MNKIDYNKCLQEVIQQAKYANIPISEEIDPIVLVNNRVTSRIGQCKRRNNKYYIEISAFMDQAEIEDIKNTLAHEILHTCPDCMNHQTKWKNYAHRMNYTYGYKIERTGSTANMNISVPKQRNYVIKCQKCNKEHIRQRMSNLTKNPDKYRCKCGGKLELIS